MSLLINKVRNKIGIVIIYIRFVSIFLLTLVKNLSFKKRTDKNGPLKLIWFGAYGNTNIGDDLIFFSLKKFIPNNVEINLSCRQQVSTTNYGVKTFHRNGKFEQYKIIREAGYVILGGGGLFEYYRYSFPSISIMNYIYPLLYARFYRKKFAIIGMGCNQERMPNFILRTVFKYLIRHADIIITRDRKSYKGFLNNGGSNKNIVSCFDPVLSLQRNNEKIENKTNEKVKVGFLLWPFFLHPYFHNSSDINKILEQSPIEKVNKHMKFIDELQKLFVILKKQNIELVFPVFHFSDQILLRQLGCDFCEDTDYDSYNKQINECDVVVSMRYHGQITSIVNNIPVISLIVQEKMEALVKNFQIEDYSIDIEMFKAEECKNQINNALNNSKVLKENLDQKYLTISKEVNAVYSKNISEFFS